MPLIRVRGAALAYDDVGPKDGPVVALFHGAGRTAADWAPHAAALAAAGYRALALDDRGHGRSEPFGPGNPVDVRMEALVDDARAWLDDVAPGPVHLVGHSRGGTVASWLAYEMEHPRAASLLVAASPPLASEAFRAHFRKLAERAPRGDGPRAALEAATYRYLAAIPDTDFPAECLTQYRGPALALEAGDDPLYSPSHTMFWRAWLKRGRSERLEGAGHDFPFEGARGEAWFRERLLAHLAEARGAGGRA